MALAQLKKSGTPEKEKEDICLFAQTNYRNQMRRFGIKTDDRRRHMYVIGKTGMGKTTLLENMVLHDIFNGNGVGVIDPHGDFAEKILDFIPSHRINDVVYFNPSDTQFPLGFNVLEVHSEEQKNLIAAGLMSVFKMIWPDVWSARMEYILNNVLLALLDSQGATLLSINRMLSDKKYRKRVVGQIKDPIVKQFWVDEYASWTEKYATEAGSAIQNKIGQFLSSSIIRNMVAQVKSTFNVREVMDSKKIFIMNLSKGRVGEDSSRLLGGMLVTKIQLAAMERVDTSEAERKDFFLYVDEFQNFATPSFAAILSEARKYRLSLIMAHQYIAQLDEVVRDAVFGNVGTMVAFRVGAADADYLAQEFTPTFEQEDIVNLSKFNVFLKLMIDGVASQPFSADTIPPIGNNTGNFDKVIQVSRERYGRSRAQIEDKIARWSGMEVEGSSSNLDEDELDDIDTTTESKVPIEKKPSVTADEKVLALKRLMEQKQTETPASISTQINNAEVTKETLDDVVDTILEEKEEVSKEETPTVTAQEVITSETKEILNAESSSEVAPTKKKRKRKRKRKRKSSTTVGSNAEVTTKNKIESKTNTQDTINPDDLLPKKMRSTSIELPSLASPIDNSNSTVPTSEISEVSNHKESDHNRIVNETIKIATVESVVSPSKTEEKSSTVEPSNNESNNISVLEAPNDSNPVEKPQPAPTVQPVSVPSKPLPKDISPKSSEEKKITPNNIISFD